MNWLAIFVSAFTIFIVGWLWYGLFFKKAWMSETGMTEEKQRKGNMTVTFGLSFIFAVLAAIYLYSNVWHEGDTEFHTFNHGAFHGAAIAVFFVLPALGTNALYEQKSWKYILINVGYWVVSFALMGGILNIWR